MGGTICVDRLIILGHDEPMAQVRLLSLLTMVLLFSHALFSAPVGEKPRSSAVDHGLDITPTPRPAPRKEPPPSSPVSPWEVSSSYRHAAGLRYGVTLEKKDSLEAGASFGVAHSWGLTPSWSLNLAADLTHPPGGQAEAQLHRVFSRSLLQPSLFVGALVHPEPRNGLAVLIAPKKAFAVAGFSLQDQWKEKGALKVEFSVLSDAHSESKFRFLVYLLRVYGGPGFQRGQNL